MDEAKIKETVWQIIVNRQTYRLEFKEQPIAKEHLEKIIDAFISYSYANGLR